MAAFKLINPVDAKQNLVNKKTQVVDIRDKQSYQDDHIDGAFHLTNDSLARFLEEVAFDTPIYVICYHGVSSKGVAQYLSEQGYLDVYNVEGGMARWRLIDPLN